jgi:outer membrane protein OmpA-like peptidoglycan-associated protein
VSGFILSHPGLHLEIEGHTDSVGSDDFNQKLSEQRAESARIYLQDAGIGTDNLVARGFGESKPVASNDSDAGRSQNRRVEMIVTGDIIGAGIEVSANELPQ